VLKLIKFNLPPSAQIHYKSSFSDHVRNDSCVSAAAIPTSGRISEEKKQFWTRFFRDFMTFLTSSCSASVTCDRREIIRRFGAL
jgi:hypothetical protein